VQRLKEIGDFLSKYGESIYNTRGGVWDANWGGTTFTDNEIYVHVLSVPASGRIMLPAVSRKISSARYLGTSVNVPFKQSEGEIVLEGIANKENKTDVIVKLDLK
jgi:alpha-L-fucosidase